MAWVHLGAVWKTTVRTPSVIAMPREPMSNSGLRPTRSMNAMATNVKITFTAEMIVEVRKARLSSNPTALQIRLE